MKTAARAKQKTKATGALLKAENIHKSYPHAAGRLEILRGVSLEISSGEMCFILGRSGAGKSTLLHILASLDQPSEGRVVFLGQDLVKLKERELSRYRNERMGFIFQFYHLLPELTLIENVLLPSIMRGKADKARAAELLERIGLADRAKHLPSQLSGGEKQRAAIARALMNEPDIVFCDEPTGNLDEETAEKVFDVIVKLNKEGQTFCIVTHEEALARRGGRVYRLHEGKLDIKS